MKCLSTIFCAAVGLLLYAPGCMPLEVTFVAFGSMAPFGPGSLSRSLPVFQLAVEELTRSYTGTVNFTYVQVPAHTCLAVVERSDDVLAKWFYQMQRPDRVLVFISPALETGCLANDASVFSLAGNWNSLAINSQAGMEIDRALQPTTLSLSFICIPTYVTLSVNLIEYYRWTSVYILWDKTSSPVNSVVSTSFADKLVNMGRHTVTFRQVASTKNSTFAQELQEFHTVSRVLFFFCHADRLRQLMISAHRMNMTTGQYVYVALEVLFYPMYYGVLSWRRNDADDATAREAYNSLLVLQPVEVRFPPTESSRNLEKRFRDLSLKVYNLTYPEGDPVIQFLTSTFDAVTIVGQVLNLTWIKYGLPALDGKHIADTMINRMFSTNFGNVYIDPDGIRIENLAITHFNADVDERQTLLIQYGNATDRLSLVGEIHNWPGPKTQWPPPNRPTCGYTADGDATCKQSAVNNDWTAAVAVIVLLMAATLFLMWRRKLKSEHEVWLFLQLNLKDLQPHLYPTSPANGLLNTGKNSTNCSYQISNTVK